MTPIYSHRQWLDAVCYYYEVTEEQVLKASKHTLYAGHAKNAFYWLCFKDKIDLYRLSEYLGKHRTTIVSTMKKGRKPDQDTINKIFTYVKAGGDETRIQSLNQ